MKLLKTLLLVSVIFLLASSASLVAASEFDWMPKFNIQAQADPSGFRARIATRFNIGDAQITTVLSNFPKPADAYVALRLGEMSGKPIDYVTEQYKENKGRGWGALAKSLGIKPGSPEFHALKRGDDLYDPKGKSKSKGKDKKNK
ncbi:MAG TPA: hypothetical protein PK874_04595 [Desulfobacteraceae bacterium]|nr:hypothetical protein [Desulfobacteraceae bacterium]HPJ67646.1 hypothetical protein [Desulfobacteraceae bacterium]HPQ29370.1 hypothetical protein [Desulfobacteraceae bacterium]